MAITRRAFHTTMLGAGAAALGGGLSPTLEAQERELVIITYGGKLQEPHRWLADRMEKRHQGLKIRLVPSESQDVVAQIKAAQGVSPYDAMPNDEPPHLIGIKEGYIQKVRPERIPNIANAYPEFARKSQGYGVPATYSLIGLAYNTQLVKTPPRSWLDLWRPEYRGLVGIPRASSNLGLGFLAIVAKLHGGAEDRLEPAFSKAKELRPVVGRSPSILTQLVERAEIGIAPLWNNGAATLADKGMPIRFVKPDPGPVAVISFFSEITGTRYPDLVADWLNGILGVDYQAMAADRPYYFGPTVKGVAVPEAAKPYTPATPEEVLQLQTIDWTKIAPVRGQIVERFDREFAS
ncbi:MAG TPA: extracellular solute-binding protein [Methylomirabilota bacterium]|nr:extracellular solute-binding protein [Methylomirabilota bacterium]